MKYGLLVCVMLFINACTQNEQTTKVEAIESMQQLHDWLQHVQSITNQQTNIFVAPDNDSLLTVEVPKRIGVVFGGSVKSTASNGRQNKAVDSETQFERDRQINTGADFRDGLLEPSQSVIRNNIDLSQADLRDIHYAGLMTQGEQTTWFVKVGERLYRVGVGDLIGVGRWSITRLSEHSMQLKVGRQTVYYDKH